MVSHIFNRPEDLSADVARGKVGGDGCLGRLQLRLSAGHACARAPGPVPAVGGAPAADAAPVVRPLVDEQVVVLGEGPVAEATRQRRRRRDEGDDEGGRGLRPALPPGGRIPRGRLELLDRRVDRKHLHPSRGVSPSSVPPAVRPRRVVRPLSSALLCSPSLFAAAPSKSISGGEKEPGAD